MTAVCNLCRQIIVSPEPPAIVGELPQVRDLQNFDILANFMLKHMAEKHRPRQRELVAVAACAQKIYAISFARSAADDFDFNCTRTIWRNAILNAICNDQAAAAAPSPGDSTGSSSDPSGSGS